MRRSELIKKMVLKYKYFFKVLINLYNYFIGFNHFKIKSKNKNKLDIRMAILKKNRININGFENIIKIDNFSKVKNCCIEINGNNNFIHIKDNVSLNGVEIVMEDDKNEICIDSYTSIEKKAHLATIESTKIIIGKDCMFASDVHLRTGDSHSILDNNGNRVNESKSIIIGNHVWIGTKVICLKGVEINKNSIVGAGTLLNNKYKEDCCIIVGNPGKIVKKNINWLRERI